MGRNSDNLLLLKKAAGQHTSMILDQIFNPIISIAEGYIDEFSFPWFNEW
jgi:hypothetical protein